MLEAFENAIETAKFAEIIDEIDEPKANSADVLLRLSIGIVRFRWRKVLLIDRLFTKSRFVKSMKSDDKKDVELNLKFLELGLLIRSGELPNSCTCGECSAGNVHSQNVLRID